MFVMSLFVFISFDWLCNALACRYVPQLLLAFGKFELHVRTWEFLSSSNVTRAFVVKVYMLRSIQLKFHYILWLGRHKKIEKFRWYRQKHPLGIFRSQASSVPARANMLTIFIHKNDTKQKKNNKSIPLNFLPRLHHLIRIWKANKREKKTFKFIHVIDYRWIVKRSRLCCVITNDNRFRSVLFSLSDVYFIFIPFLPFFVCHLLLKRATSIANKQRFNAVLAFQHLYAFVLTKSFERRTKGWLNIFRLLWKHIKSNGIKTKMLFLCSVSVISAFDSITSRKKSRQCWT